MSFKKIVVVGGGVLGSQIAYQTAYKGFDVTVYLRSEASIERAKPKFKRLHDIYLAELEKSKGSFSNSGAYCRGLVPDFTGVLANEISALEEKANKAYEELRYETDLAAAVKDADLVIEALAENLADKKVFYANLKGCLPAKTILVTNSSTLLPSMIADDTGRPEKFLALHFANEIWKNNTAEIMGHDRTDPAAYDQVVEFAAAIGMVPLKLKKEKAGYILNSMLVPFLMSAQSLLVNDISDPETIDKTWMLATGAPFGPFRILDIVGITTAYNILLNFPDTQSDPTSEHARLAKMLKENYLDQGKTGINAGEGFYRYR